MTPREEKLKTFLKVSKPSALLRRVLSDKQLNILGYLPNNNDLKFWNNFTLSHAS